MTKLANRSFIIPDGWHSVTPRIVAHGAEQFVDFLKQVFGATGEYQQAIPSVVRIGDSVVMISDAGIRGPMAAFLYVYVDDTDAVYNRALSAGATSLEEPFDTPYGDRRCMVEDKWGNTWQIATHIPGVILPINIDFSQIDDEGLEFLTEDLLRRQGVTIESRPSRGPDQGKDLLVKRNFTDDMGITGTEQYLVECKHFFGSGKSVRESDIGNFDIKMQQHNANRYLLVTTSTVSQTVKDQLQAVSNDESSPRKAIYWSRFDLIAKIHSNPDIYRKYFHSWQIEVAEAVDYIKEHFYRAHRGALLWCPGITAIFGNDGYRDTTTQSIVEKVKRELANRNVEEIAFASDNENFSWVLLVRAGNAHELHDLIWMCSKEASDHPISLFKYEHEKLEAHDQLYSYWGTPHKPKCPMPTKVR